MLRRVVVVIGIVLAALTPSVALAAPAGGSPSGDVSVAAPCAYDGDHPEIEQGDSGAVVAHLQCLLRNVWGYTKVAVDGQFGSITRTAVVAHQTDCRIGVDGIVGPETWRHLHPDTTTKECTD